MIFLADLSSLLHWEPIHIRIDKPTNKSYKESKYDSDYYIEAEHEMLFKVWIQISLIYQQYLSGILRYTI